MIKPLFKILILLSLIFYQNVIFAENQILLKNPQGRMGLSYKPEKYSNIFKTNISSTELENIVKTNKESEINDKKAQLSAQKQKEKELKQQEKAQLSAQKQKEKEEKLLAKQKEIIDKNEEKQTFFNKKTIVKTEETQNENPIPPQKTEIKQSIAHKKKPQQDQETIDIVNEINKELYNEKQKMLEELSILWVNAVQKSDTVYFAIMKLSNPNGDEVNKNGFKKILEPIINAAPLVGQAFVNPALTAGSLIGSNVMGTMMNDNANRRLSKVNDADLVILARAIDELQEKLLLNYMAYKSTLAEYKLTIQIANERKKTYEKMNKNNSPNLILANTFYTEAMDNQYKARQEFLMKRVVLEQMVGADAINEIEKNNEGIN